MLRPTEAIGLRRRHIEDDRQAAGAEEALAQSLRRGYRDFNKGDLEAAASLLAPDVNWANTIEGGREAGRDAVRSYWAQLFGLLAPRVEPLRLRADGQGRIVVDAHEHFSDAATGQPLAHRRVQHVFTFRDGLIRRMDTLEPTL